MQKTLIVGGEKTLDKGGKQRYLKRGENELLFLAGDWVFRDLNKSVDDFRDKTIARFTQEQATKIEVKRQDGQNFTLTRGADKKWTIDKPGEGVFQDTTATQLVSALADLRGYEIASENPSNLASYNLSTPALTIVAYDEKNTQLASIIAGQSTTGDAKKTFAMAKDGKVVFALRDYMFDRLNKAPSEFWVKPEEKKPDPAAETSAESLHTHSEEEGGEDLPDE
jgi:hypothetical protein